MCNLVEDGQTIDGELLVAVGEHHDYAAVLGTVVLVTESCFWYG
jgi:hypothetical protein